MTDFIELDRLFRCYKPPAFYRIRVVNAKRNNKYHSSVDGALSYPLYLNIGKHGCICFMAGDMEFHRLLTSPVKRTTPWGGGEDTITVETENTTYVLTKLK